MKILMTGITGLIGGAVSQHLMQSGHEVIGLTRNHQLIDKKRFFHWDPIQDHLDENALNGVDGIIHLAGDNIAKGRWTQRKKEQLVRSRLDSTRLLVKAIASCTHPPQFMMNASAIGIYGNCHDQVLDESSPHASDFLGQLCSEWEQTLFQLNSDSTRTIALRFGLVLSPEGGALKRMLPAFKFGGGAILGTGRQYVSWISIRDVVRVIDTCLQDDSLCGPINCVTPHPVRFSFFAKELGNVLKRPVWMRIPSTMVKWLFGEMGTATLLASCRVHPRKLLDSGFQFNTPRLNEALKELLSV